MAIVERNINGINIAIDINSGSKILFEKEFVRKNKINIDRMSTRNLLEILSKDSVYVPLYLKWEITAQCNKDCPFCYIHNHTENTEVDLEKNKEIIDFLYDKGLVLVVLTGGECTLYKDFLNLYRYLKIKGILVEIYTNGTNITEEILHLFEIYKPYRVEVSIYNMDEKVLNTILTLKKLGINIVAKCTVNKLTYPYFYEIKNWCEKNDILFYFSTEIFDAYDGTALNEYELDRNEKLVIDALRLNKSDYSYGKKKCLSCGAGRYALSLKGMELRLCPRLNLYTRKLTLDESYKRIIDFIHIYKNVTIEGCSGCEAAVICKMCMARAIVSREGVTVPCGYCESIKSYYKELRYMIRE